MKKKENPVRGLLMILGKINIIMTTKRRKKRYQTYPQISKNTPKSVKSHKLNSTISQKTAKIKKLRQIYNPRGKMSTSKSPHL